MIHNSFYRDNDIRKMFDDVNDQFNFIKNINQTIKTYDEVTSVDGLNLIKKIEMNVDELQVEAKHLEGLAKEYKLLTEKVNKYEDSFIFKAILNRGKYNKNILRMTLINAEKNNTLKGLESIKKNILDNGTKLKHIVDNEFKNVNIAKYIAENYKEKDKMKAYKFKKVKARVGKVGEGITTIMKNGLVETVNTVKVDEKTGKKDWIITNPDGEEYIIAHKTFEKKYNQQADEKGYYHPSGGLVSVVELKDNVTFKAPWGEDMNIKKGGFLVVNKPDDIYGIGREEFFNTYKIKEPANVEEPTNEI